MMTSKTLAKFDPAVLIAFGCIVLLLGIGSIAKPGFLSAAYLVQQLQTAVVILDQRGAVLHPVAVVAVQRGAVALDAGLVDVPADVPVVALVSRRAGRGEFESAHVAPGSPHPRLDP